MIVDRIATTGTGTSGGAVMGNSFSLARILGRVVPGRFFVGASGSVGFGFGVSPLLRLARTAVLLTLFATSLLAIATPISALASTTLPDGRAYELVSPVDKNGAQVTLGRGSFRASADGTAIMFDSNVASGDTRGTGGFGAVTFRSDRQPGGWSAQAIMPAQDVNPWAATNGAGFDWFAPDLSHGILRASDPPLLQGAPHGVPNLYLTDGNGSPIALLTSSVNPLVPRSSYAPGSADVSNDLSHIVFESSQNLTPDAPPQGPFCATFEFCAPRVYEWEGGIVRLEGVLPNGAVAPDGSVAGPPGGVTGGGGADGGEVLSEDGSRLYFSAPPGGQSSLYLRKDNKETVWVSQSEASAPAVIHGAATFAGASGDGKRAFFLTDEQLTDADHDTFNDLYMFQDSADPEHDVNLTLVSNDLNPSDQEGAFIDGVLGSSDDGTRVYFAAEGRIVPGQPTNDFGPKLYVWDHGTVTYIATVDFDRDAGNWAPQAIRRSSRVSHDGSYLIFTSSATRSPGESATYSRVYRYSLSKHKTECVSCLQDGGALGDASISFTGDTATRQYPGYASRALSYDGQTVFFNTSQALVGNDTNGKVDVYEWRDGVVSLLSKGEGDGDSYFVDASATGSDVFFVTSDSLVATDVDEVRDVYDARVDGGFVAPLPGKVACEGEVCQGAETPPPPDLPTPATSLLQGAGNLKPVVFTRSSKPSSKAQKLRKALKACKAQHKKAKRRKCESSARRRFGKSGGSK